MSFETRGGAGLNVVHFVISRKNTILLLLKSQSPNPRLRASSNSATADKFPKCQPSQRSFAKLSHKSIRSAHIKSSSITVEFAVRTGFASTANTSQHAKRAAARHFASTADERQNAKRAAARQFASTTNERHTATSAAARKFASTTN